MRTRYGLAGAFLVCSFVLVGCGGGKKLYPVEGTVSLDGEMLEGATVSFANDSGTLSSGLTSASGKFKLLTSGQEGVPAGTYKVTVTKIKAKLPPGGGNLSDPTKTYTEMMKTTGMKFSKQGTLEGPKEKSEIPDRYGKPGAIPDQVVPASGPIVIELKGK